MWCCSVPKPLTLLPTGLFVLYQKSLAWMMLFVLTPCPLLFKTEQWPDNGGQFSSHIWASIIAGIILSFPYVIWEGWRFIKPGLTKIEIRYSRLGLLFSSFLFFLGVSFGYFLIAPLSIKFLGTYQVSDSIINEIDLSSYVSTIVIVTLASGLIFQLPVIVYALTKIGLITPSFLKNI